MELEALQEVFSEVESLGATLVAISPQLQKYQKQTANKFGLSFHLLCDEGNKVASQFGVAWTMPEKMQDLYQTFGIDLERFNGDNSWQLQMPGRFIIDRKGIVRSAEVHPDYTSRPEPAEIIELIKSLG